ncbi:hypothetical protein [Rhodococcus sp. HM1]|nr:hypothetical protein [Rhodococcus sp. HM1]
MKSAPKAASGVVFDCDGLLTEILIGYARCSTVGRDLRAQRTSLTRLGR